MNEATVASLVARVTPIDRVGAEKPERCSVHGDGPPVRKGSAPVQGRCPP